ncbi:hypothetical protein [Streptomyces demainii]|uniref:Uncharacterized protein n=1 Tax=Streptomyces demainii TaxID=588122 RepID=A0ABT9KWN5_9ACTN|nr:hypothetical protein [Streptomyces demainii]MDP9612851.1 hypothetical protein [Streptomyces demainii]
MDNKIWVFTTNGEWRQAEDPLVSHRHLDDWEAEVKAAGYSSWAKFPQQDATPLALEIYRSDKAGSELLFIVNVSTSSYYETVYAESVPALMELLGRWTPVVQGAALGALAGQLNDKGVITSVARNRNLNAK